MTIHTSPNILTEIINHKRIEVAEARRLRPESLLLDQLKSAPEVRDFVGALSAASDIGLIAEVKKGSPSAGIIRVDFDPVEIARTYEAHGANCLSVLTDEHFFLGHLDYLRAIRSAVNIPVLRKDFMIEPADLRAAWEEPARAASASQPSASRLPGRYWRWGARRAAWDSGLPKKTALPRPEPAKRWSRQ